jgi:hypothetical protein
MLRSKWRRTVYPRHPARVFCFPGGARSLSASEMVFPATAMDKKKFIKELRITADVLKPLTESLKSRSLKWNGREYAGVICSKEEEKEPDPYALAWMTNLTTMAELLEAQQTPLSKEQIAYLDSILFGGMGSLTDLQFDPKEFGDIANIINDQLKIQTTDLYESLIADDPSR